MAKSGRRRSKPVAVSQTLVQILGDLGLDGAQRAFEVGEHWARAVGEDVAEQAAEQTLIQRPLPEDVPPEDLEPGEHPFVLMVVPPP